MLFDDRAHAGRILAGRLAPYGGRRDVVVVALSGGGLTVAWEVAKRLGARLGALVGVLAGADPQSPEPKGKTVLLVDDGLSQADALRAAISSLRRLRPARIVAALPVASPGLLGELRTEADEAFSAAATDGVLPPGLWYRSAPPVPDEEVRGLLEGRCRLRARGSTRTGRGLRRPG
jgi:predicted phosphoribosyltransferase